MVEHPAIRKLKEALTNTLITEGRMVAPPCSTSEHGKPWHCCHPVTHLRLFADLPGVMAVCWWCETCGWRSQAVKRASVAPDLLASLEPADMAVRDKWEAAQRVIIAAMYKRVEHDEAMTEKQIRYSEFMRSPAWTTLRNRRLKLDGYICADCGGSATTAHHIVYPREEFWPDTPLWTLVSLCATCHEKAHRIYAAGVVPWSIFDDK